MPVWNCEHFNLDLLWKAEQLNRITTFYLIVTEIVPGFWSAIAQAPENLALETTLKNIAFHL